MRKMYSPEKPVKTGVFTRFSAEYIFLIFYRKFMNICQLVRTGWWTCWFLLEWFGKFYNIFFRMWKNLFQQWSSLGILGCNLANQLKNLRRFVNLFVQADEHSDFFWNDFENFIIIFVKKIYENLSTCSYWLMNMLIPLGVIRQIL